MGAERIDLAYDPDNPNANIHGMVTGEGGQTCYKQNRCRCSACCFALRIEEIEKPENTHCDYQVSGGGCIIHNAEGLYPEACARYHCSQSSGNIQKWLRHIEGL